MDVWQTPAVACETGGAAAAGTWTLGDLTVNRIGFGAIRSSGEWRPPTVHMSRTPV